MAEFNREKYWDRRKALVAEQNNERWLRPMPKEVEIHIVNATELKPDAKYIIVLDRASFSIEELHRFLTVLDQMGVKNKVVLRAADTEHVKIIEQSEEN